MSGAGAGFFGWRVVWAAFVIAVFGWGVSFYGPPVFLEAIHEKRGWPVSLVSAAVTCHFLLGALIVANLAGLHRRFGLVAVTRAGAVAAAVGIVGWAAAQEPWELFAATVLSGFGWAATGGAAIDAMVSPWFARRRPEALIPCVDGPWGSRRFDTRWLGIACAHVSGLLARPHDRWPRWVPQTSAKQDCGLN